MNAGIAQYPAIARVIDEAADDPDIVQIAAAMGKTRQQIAHHVRRMGKEGYLSQSYVTRRQLRVVGWRLTRSGKALLDGYVPADPKGASRLTAAALLAAWRMPVDIPSLPASTPVREVYYK